MKRRLIATCLACFMVLSTATIAFADCDGFGVYSEIEHVTVYGQDEDNQVYTVARTFDGDGVEVAVTDCNGNLLAKSIRGDNSITVIDYTDPNRPVDVSDELELETGPILIGSNSENVEDTKSITWGNWTSKTVTFNATGMTVAAVVAYLAAAFVGVPLFVISDIGNVFLHFEYTYATVKIRMRMGTDANYQYAQEEITIWGHNTLNGTKYLVYGPSLRQQKKSLNSKTNTFEQWRVTI